MHSISLKVDENAFRGINILLACPIISASTPLIAKLLKSGSRLAVLTNNVFLVDPGTRSKWMSWGVSLFAPSAEPTFALSEVLSEFATNPTLIIDDEGVIMEALPTFPNCSNILGLCDASRRGCLAMSHAITSKRFPGPAVSLFKLYTMLCSTLANAERVLRARRVLERLPNGNSQFVVVGFNESMRQFLAEMSMSGMNFCVFEPDPWLALTARASGLRLLERFSDIDRHSNVLLATPEYLTKILNNPSPDLRTLTVIDLTGVEERFWECIFRKLKVEFSPQKWQKFTVGNLRVELFRGSELWLPTEGIFHDELHTLQVKHSCLVHCALELACGSGGDRRERAIKVRQGSPGLLRNVALSILDGRHYLAMAVFSFF